MDSEHIGASAGSSEQYLDALHVSVLSPAADHTQIAAVVHAQQSHIAAYSLPHQYARHMGLI